MTRSSRARRRFLILGALGLLAGSALGAVAHQAQHLAGVWPAVLTVSCFGLAAGLIVAWAAPSRLWTRLELSEAKVTIPHLGEVKFVLNREQQKVAWKLFVEIITRVATQPLAEGEGLAREALESLHGLFGTTRSLLAGMNPSPLGEGFTVEQLAVLMLNRELRPFLSEWHPRLKRFEDESAAAKTYAVWDREAELRRELDGLSQRLLAYGRSFGHLAEVKGLDRFFAPAAPRKEAAGA
ncbi:MAG: hypothetical protein WAM82_27970 [Thermoanaerobaculia bacterium]